MFLGYEQKTWLKSCVLNENENLLDSFTGHQFADLVIFIFNKNDFHGKTILTTNKKTMACYEHVRRMEPENIVNKVLTFKYPSTISERKNVDSEGV